MTLGDDVAGSGRRHAIEKDGERAKLGKNVSQASG